MTKTQMDNMTEAEMDKFTDDCLIFDETMTLDEYKEAVRDCIYIGGLQCGIKYCTWEYVNRRVERYSKSIESFYEERASVNEAVTDVEYGGG